MIQNYEHWEPVKGFEKLYEVSNEGRVRTCRRIVTDAQGRTSVKEPKIIKPYIAKQTGYPTVGLWKDGKQYTKLIHILIANAFIPNPDNLPCINHKDEIRSHSVLSNLERCTYEYNNNYGDCRLKRSIALKGRSNPYKGVIRKDNMTVLQYSINGELINTFPDGIPQIKKELGFGAAVASCVRHKSNTAFGYVWRYDGDPFTYQPKKRGEKLKKPVIQLDFDGNILARFPSIKDAAEAIGNKKYAPDITNACKGNLKTSHGYKWKYSD